MVSQVPPAGTSICIGHNVRAFISAAVLLMSSESLSPEVLIEKIERALPSQLGRGLVVAWRGIVMETMIDALINVRSIGIGHVICLKRFLVDRPFSGDARIQRCVVE
jgi:hypothetical protein